MDLPFGMVARAIGAIIGACVGLGKGIPEEICETVPLRWLDGMVGDMPSAAGEGRRSVARRPKVVFQDSSSRHDASVVGSATLGGAGKPDR